MNLSQLPNQSSTWMAVCSAAYNDLVLLYGPLAAGIYGAKIANYLVDDVPFSPDLPLQIFLKAQPVDKPQAIAAFESAHH